MKIKLKSDSVPNTDRSTGLARYINCTEVLTGTRKTSVARIVRSENLSDDVNITSFPYAITPDVETVTDTQTTDEPSSALNSDNFQCKR